jgi:hypothetical protein
MRKKLVAAILLFSFLGSTTELHELTKLPHLVIHFVEHYSNSSEESLGEFLYEHYTHNHSGDQDEHHDKGCLPFQGNHACQTFTAALYFEPSPDFNIAVNSQSPQKHYPVSESIKSTYSANIWQPPKIG